MSLPLMKNYINGEWVESNSTTMGDVWNPAQGEKIAQVAYGTSEDVDKAVKAANRRMVKYPALTSTVPHEVIGHYGASRVILIPARPGTGIIAGGCVRAVVESAGVTDILTKSFGSNNPTNLVKATFNALSKLRTKEEIQRLRGVEI